jgi:hypothetical protein
MHENRLVDAIRELAEQLRARVAVAAFGARCDTCQQMVDGRGERADVRMVCREIHATRQPAADSDSLNLPGKLADHSQLASLQSVQHEQ